ncbi:hypothetical protein IQ06DRAFT_298771 [Phaeosphaeriaceae sp. SRC1lsM3a]|nr:hypothetical protein IQ06DRAFT_298771 [Stagonospora sp. SRC1lsM3a]
MYRFITTFPRDPRVLSSRTLLQARKSSGSPTAGNKPPEHFIKTGEKEDDPAKVNSRSNEYSQSGGDEMVAAQESASFQSLGGNDPAISKEAAGKGNKVNPLEFSPATPDLSKTLEDKDVSQSKERDASQHTGQGISRKAKKVPKTSLDFKE